MARVYCVEDDESIRELILYALKSGAYEAEGFENSTELYEGIKKNTPDLILLDVMLPTDDGFNILRKLKEHNMTKAIPVIMLTAKASEYDKVKGLDLGADDYVTKPFGVMELLSRIRAVLRRYGSDVTGSAISCGEISINPEKRTVNVCDTPCSLTFKEFELLYFLVRNNGIVLSRDRLLQEIWGYDFEGESRTVDMHIKTLRQKLQECGASDVIKTVRSVGYKFEV